jgi:hypothetical protein
MSCHYYFFFGPIQYATGLMPFVFYRETFLSQASDEAVPVPVVMIDQDSDRDATIVHLSFGDRLGALLDTV